MGEQGRVGRGGADSGRKLAPNVCSCGFNSASPGPGGATPTLPGGDCLPAQPTISLEVSFLPLTSESEAPQVGRLLCLLPAQSLLAEWGGTSMG